MIDDYWQKSRNEQTDFSYYLIFPPLDNFLAWIPVLLSNRRISWVWRFIIKWSVPVSYRVLFSCLWVHPAPAFQEDSAVVNPTALVLVAWLMNLFFMLFVSLILQQEIHTYDCRAEYFWVMSFSFYYAMKCLVFYCINILMFFYLYPHLKLLDGLFLWDFCYSKYQYHRLKMWIKEREHCRYLQ